MESFGGEIAGLMLCGEGGTGGMHELLAVLASAYQPARWLGKAARQSVYACMTRARSTSATFSTYSFRLPQMHCECQG